jgi:D-tagatose-1,6-bisphosphate aldolase subunit GatZ/KbaZ
MGFLLDVIDRHSRGEGGGVYSVCSAHPMVIEAGLLQARSDDTCALIEATSNQVDQFGGYTGMTPPVFRDYVMSIAERLNFPRDRIVLGGDHLGPNRWQKQDSGSAMAHAETLIESYVAAGFGKIHLDCSMACEGDITPISDDVAAGRAARLAEVAERAAHDHFGKSSILYIIGTEVPTPGGAHETIDALAPTSPDAARTTIARHKEAFERRGLADCWSRVIGLVVQPGVEFDHFQVVDYQPERAQQLSKVVENYQGLVFEAHSTDYQTPAALASLVEDHFAILKVGPALTFALREALFALAWIEEILVAPPHCSNIRQVVEHAMLDSPESWRGYYPGNPSEQHFARQYSFSDRIRYYWHTDAVQAAERTLFANLRAQPLPLPLISQFFPEQFRRIRAKELAAEAHDLVVDRIRDVLRSYARACSPQPSPSK